MDTHERDDINDVLDDVIVKINRITGHVSTLIEIVNSN